MSPSASPVARLWNAFFFEGAAADRLGMLRILLGLGLVAFHASQFTSFFQLETFGPTWHYIEPIWYFRLLGIETMHPGLAQLIYVVLMVATICFAAGFKTRTALGVVLLSILALKGMRDSVAGDVHHRYLMPFTVLGFLWLSRCGDALSLDERFRRKRGKASPPLAEWEASWPIKASQLYMCSFYFWSAIAKARMSGLAWAEPDRIQTLLTERAVRFGLEEGVPAGSTAAWQLAQNETLSGMLAASTYVFEFGFPLILLIKPPALRWIFFAGITGFHVGNFLLIDVKFLFLPVLFLIFFDVSVPLHWWRARRGSEQSG